MDEDYKASLERMKKSLQDLKTTLDKLRKPDLKDKTETRSVYADSLMECDYLKNRRDKTRKILAKITLSSEGADILPFPTKIKVGG